MKRLLSLVILVFTLFGCSTRVEKSKSGSIFFSIDNVNARTILPDVSKINPAKYVLSFTGPDTMNNMELTNKNGSVPNIAIGTWKVDILAYDNTDLSIAKIIAKGSKDNIIVESGKTTTANINIDLLQTAGVKGNTSLLLDWSFDSTVIDGFDGKIRNIEESSYRSIANSNFTITSNSLKYVDNLESGFYILNINLKKGSDIKIPYWEVIHIYDNVDSSKEVVLKASDFTGIPSNPVSVDSEEVKGGIKLSWIDNNNIETGYVVERYNPITNSWVVIATLPGGSEEYIDNSAPENVDNKYRVKAINDDGESSGTETGYIMWGKPIPGKPAGGKNGETSSSNITHNSFDLTWTDATDSTPGSGLKYKVVISESNNISSVSQTDIPTSADGKTLVIDWSPMPGTMPFKIDSLKDNTTYYVNVLVKDSVGNISSYVEATGNPATILQVTTLSGSGTLEVSITVNAIPDLNIVFQKGNGEPISNRDVLMGNSPIALRTSQVYDSYIWIVENTDISLTSPAGYTITPKTPATSEILTIGANTLDIGLRTITVICKKDDKSYSERISIIVGN